MPYIDQHNFDWSKTNKRIVVYIPNFGRKNYLIPTLQRMKFDLPKDQWVILVVNDGIHEDLSDSEQYNLCWFTFERGPNPKERNGCLIRNYILRRLQSRIVATRDPEIFIEGNNYLNAISCLEENQVYRPCEMVELRESDVAKIFENPLIDLSKLKMRCVHSVTNHNYRAFHAGFAMHTNKLVELGGYEEEFGPVYGWEDVNLLERIIASKMDFIIDNSVKTYHIFHPRKVKFLKTVRDGGMIYQRKKREILQGSIIANQKKEWGNG